MTKRRGSQSGNVSADLREFRRVVQATRQIAHDIRATLGELPPQYREMLPAPPAADPPPQLPPQYDYVSCKQCNEPAILVRDMQHNSFAALCPVCRTISHLETVTEEKR